VIQHQATVALIVGYSIISNEFIHSNDWRTVIVIVPMPIILLSTTTIYNKLHSKVIFVTAQKLKSTYRHYYQC